MALSKVSISGRLAYKTLTNLLSLLTTAHRSFTEKQASTYGLTGWVKNTSDDKVRKSQHALLPWLICECYRSLVRRRVHQKPCRNLRRILTKVHPPHMWSRSKSMTSRQRVANLLSRLKLPRTKLNNCCWRGKMTRLAAWSGRREEGSSRFLRSFESL